MSDLDHLTDAERAALADDELDQDLDPDPGAADDGDADDRGDASDDASGDPDATADAGDASQADGADAGEADAAADAAAPSFRVPTGDLNAITQAITELVASKDALESAYEAGDSELTYAEHRAKLREIDAALLDLNAERAEAGLVHRMAGEARQKDWRRQIEETRREAGRLGLDLKPGSELEAQWDRAVKYLGADPANNHRDAAWFLREALNMVAARHGKHPATRDDHRPGAGSRGAAPADLEGLKGLALEQALARMSPEQADQWLNS